MSNYFSLYYSKSIFNYDSSFKIVMIAQCRSLAKDNNSTMMAHSTGEITQGPLPSLPTVSPSCRRGRACVFQ